MLQIHRWLERKVNNEMLTRSPIEFYRKKKLPPQHQTFPSSVSAIVKKPPQATAATGTGNASTLHGTLRPPAWSGPRPGPRPNLPSPSSRPHVYNSPVILKEHEELRTEESTWEIKHNHTTPSLCKIARQNKFSWSTIQIERYSNFS